MREALSTLPWVEKDAIRPNVRTQEVTFGFKNKDDFKLDEVKEAIEGRTNFKLGKVIKEPTQ